MESKDAEKEIKNAAVGADTISFSLRLSAANMAQWVLMSLGMHGSKYPAVIYGDKELDAVSLRKNAVNRILYSDLQTDIANVPEDDADKMGKRLSFDYGFASEAEIPAKVSVSDVKLEAIREQEEKAYEVFRGKEPEIYLPTFDAAYREEESVNYGARRGTAVHRVMECLDFTQPFTEASVKNQTEALVSSGRLEKEQAEMVHTDEILTFGRTELCKRMAAADQKGTLHKEQPFVMSLPACEIFPEQNSEAPTLIQGIIDAFFEEEDGYVLMDYKTDKVETAQELIDHYRV